MYQTIKQIFDKLNVELNQKYMQYENEILGIYNSTQLNPLEFNLDDSIILHLIALRVKYKNMKYYNIY